MPLLCNLSDAYENEVRMTAATAYGGTVSSWARASAEKNIYILELWNQRLNKDGDVLKPNVVIMVGKNAEIADRALLSPK